MYKLRQTPTKKPIILQADPEQDICSIRKNHPYWQGIVVGIDISLNVN